MWDAKVSHPWILKVMLPYDGNGNGGMPEMDVYHTLDDFENQIMEQLKDYEGYLNIGRETGQNERVIYFACQEFRTPSQVLHTLVQKYKMAADYTIYKDKYWRSFNKYI